MSGIAESVERLRVRILDPAFPAGSRLEAVLDGSGRACALVPSPRGRSFHERLEAEAFAEDAAEALRFLLRSCGHVRAPAATNPPKGFHTLSVRIGWGGDIEARVSADAGFLKTASALSERLSLLELPLGLARLSETEAAEGGLGSGTLVLLRAAWRRFDSEKEILVGGHRGRADVWTSRFRAWAALTGGANAHPTVFGTDGACHPIF